MSWLPSVGPAVPEPVGDVALQVGENLGGEQFDPGAADRIVGPADAGGVLDLVSERFVVAVHLVDDLGGAAHEVRPALDRILERRERRRHAESAGERLLRVVARAELVDGASRVAMDVQPGRAGADERVGGIAAVVDPPFAVVVDERLVLLERSGHVGGEQRIAPLGGEVGRQGRRRAAVPDADRLLDGPGRDVNASSAGR